MKSIGLMVLALFATAASAQEITCKGYYSVDRGVHKTFSKTLEINLANWDFGNIIDESGSLGSLQVGYRPTGVNSITHETVIPGVFIHYTSTDSTLYRAGSGAKGTSTAAARDTYLWIQGLGDIADVECQ